MSSLLFSVFSRLSRFEQWFDQRFGWFFTNGMKERKADGSSWFRA